MNITLVRRSALLLPSFAEGLEHEGVPGALQTIRAMTHVWLVDGEAELLRRNAHTRFVIAGLDPAIHPTSPLVESQHGSVGQARG